MKIWSIFIAFYAQLSCSILVSQEIVSYADTSSKLLSESSFLSLPKEIGNHILSFLKPIELCKTSSVSKKFNELHKEVAKQRFQAGIRKKKPYFDAIQHIRSKLESCILKYKHIENGFKNWPNPNPYYFRTPAYLFLETEKWRDSEKICTLWTPLGEVKLLGGGSFDQLVKCSGEFLNSMKTD